MPQVTKENIMDYVRHACIYYPYVFNLWGTLDKAKQYGAPEECIKELAIRVLTKMLCIRAERSDDWVKRMIERLIEENNVSSEDFREALIRAYEYEIFSMEIVVSFVKGGVENDMQNLIKIFYLTEVEIREAPERVYVSALIEGFKAIAERIQLDMD